MLLGLGFMSMQPSDIVESYAIRSGLTMYCFTHVMLYHVLRYTH